MGGCVSTGANFVIFCARNCKDILILVSAETHPLLKYAKRMPSGTLIKIAFFRLFYHLCLSMFKLNIFLPYHIIPVRVAFGNRERNHKSLVSGGGSGSGGGSSGGGSKGGGSGSGGGNNGSGAGQSPCPL